MDKKFVFTGKGGGTALIKNGVAEIKISPTNSLSQEEYFDVFASTDGMQACMCSYKDSLMVSCTSHFINTEIEKNFFRTLTSNDIKVTINANIVEEDDIDEEML